jgi:putative PIN family toxin of toxin-antitoxin system
VPDTNVLVSALITKGTPPDLLYQAWDADTFQLVTSREQIDELRRVMAYKKLQSFIKPNEAEALLETIDAAAVVVGGIPNIDLSPDPDDNVILATAIAGKADLLVSGDKSGLLALEAAHGIPIVTPKARADSDRNLF